MTEPIHVVWIDDKFNDPNDARTIQAISISEAGRDNLKLDLVQSTTEDVLGLVKQFSKVDQTLPDILMLDFKLARAPDFDESLKVDDGYKLRKMLELTPLRLVPKYLVSAIFDEKKVGPNIEGFEWILADPVDSDLVSSQLISDGGAYRIVNSFALKLNSDQNEAFNLLLEELRTPESDFDELIDLVHHVFGRFEQTSIAKEYADIDKTGLKIEAKTLEISRWLRGVFLVRLGLLIDAPSAANLLGVDQDYFTQKLAKLIFKERPSASYQGLFSHKMYPRWWRSEVINWVLELYDDIVAGPISHLAPLAAQKLNVPDSQRSRCVVCGDLWPDVVAYDLDDPDVIRQVHRYCSEENEDMEILPGFDELRFFKKD
jgi:hypothetical protein